MRALLPTALALLAAGCTAGVACPAGFVQQGSLCLEADAGGGADGGSCGGRCTGATPFCVADACVACRSSTDCRAEASICRPSDHACVACTTSIDCTAPAAAVCDVARGTCGACSRDGDCAHLGSGLHCTGGACVECSVLDESACGANSCDPATGRCTSTPRASVAPCGACLADSECMTGQRCVPMTFMGTPRPGGFCLSPAGTAGCGACGSLTPPRASLSGAAAETYCGVAEDYATCESVRDANAYVHCATDGDCGAAGLPDARCQATTCVSGCSVSCQCPGGFGYSCRADHFCG